MIGVLGMLIGVTIYFKSNTYNPQMELLFKKSSDYYKWEAKPTDVNDPLYFETTFLDGLQASYSCCGFTGLVDWDVSPYRPKVNTSNDGYYPRSCCIKPDIEMAELESKLCRPKMVYQKSCGSAVRSSWERVGINIILLAALHFFIAYVSRIVIKKLRIERAMVRAQEAAGNKLAPDEMSLPEID